MVSKEEMAPKRIVLHHENTDSKEIEVDFFAQYSSVVSSSLPAVDHKKNVSSPHSLESFCLEKRNSGIFDCFSEQEDLLGLSLNYVVNQTQKEVNEVCNISAKSRVAPYKASEGNFQIPSMDSDAFSEYPDDTDRKNDVKEYEAWKSRRKSGGEEDLHQSVESKH